MWHVGDDFVVVHTGIQNTTIGKTYSISIISTGHAKVTEYAFLDDTGNLIYIMEYIFNSCVAKPLPIITTPPNTLSPNISMNWVNPPDDDDEFDLLDAFEYFKKQHASPKCSCGASSVGHPGHANHCDLVTGRNSFK